MSPDVPLLPEVSDAERSDAAGQPRYDSPDYRSTELRAPRKPLLPVSPELKDRLKAILAGIGA